MLPVKTFGTPSGSGVSTAATGVAEGRRLGVEGSAFAGAAASTAATGVAEGRRLGVEGAASEGAAAVGRRALIGVPRASAVLSATWLLVTVRLSA